jgi:hypothetical protein
MLIATTVGRLDFRFNKYKSFTQDLFCRGTRLVLKIIINFTAFTSCSELLLDARKCVFFQLGGLHPFYE